MEKHNFNPPLHKLVQFNVLDRGKIKYKHKRIQIIKIQSFSFLQNKNVIEITLLVELFNIWRNHKKNATQSPDEPAEPAAEGEEEPPKPEESDSEKHTEEKPQNEA